MNTNKEDLEKAKLTLDGKSWSWGYLIEGSYFDFDEEQIDSENPYGCEYNMGDGCWSLFIGTDTRTKEVYEVCEYGNKQSNKVYDFEQGKELFRCSGSGRDHGYLKIETIEELFDSIIEDEQLYIKVTKPIEWWEDAVDFIVENKDDELSAYFDKQSGYLRVNASLPRDKWCDFARILLEQGE